MIVSIPMVENEFAADTAFFGADLNEMASVRMDRIARVKRLIREDRYETPERLDRTAEMLSAELLQGSRGR